jgi:3-hydroxymyristoyl/3-hydroxydecanoyl-(acyl carrier protein) dehydratase
MTSLIAVPADGPLFEGHFPGRPILPGIAELALVADALSPVEAEGSVSAIPFARFRGVVLPGDRLEVDSSPRAQGGVRFEVKRAGEVVANGAMTFGDPRARESTAVAMASRATRGAPPIDELIPHRPPMLFVDRILGEADDGLTCLARIPGACALVTRGSTPAFVGLEAAAQAAAVWEALARSRATGGPSARTGYLVSLRDVVLYRPTLPADADLIVSIRLVATAPPLTTYAVDAAVYGELALRGTIGTYLTG